MDYTNAVKLPGSPTANGAPPMSSSNMVSLQIPTTLGGANNVSFDFGPNANTLANSAYSFLNASFANDTAFVGSAISGAQNFYSGLVKPATDAASAQVARNTELLPSLYTSLLDTTKMAMSISQSIANTSMQTSAAIAGNTVREQSRVARRTGKPRGWCFITTACCEFAGLEDDCYILETLRKFRDEYMRIDPDRSALVDEYYETAPAIVEGIKKRADAKLVFETIKEIYISEAIAAIEKQDFGDAMQTYILMVSFARRMSNE